MKKVILTALLFLPLSLFAQKFGHFDSSEIVKAMPEYAKSQTEIQNLSKQFEDEIKRMQDELTKKVKNMTVSTIHFPTTSRSVANRNFRSFISAFSRLPTTTAIPCRLLRPTRCAKSHRKSLMPLKLWAMRANMFTSWM